MTTADATALRSDLERRIRLIEDRIAIRELTARYNRAVDDGRPEDLAACFTEDGKYWLDRDGRLTSGREHIANMSRVIGYGTVHFTVDAVIEVDGDTATQVCHNLCAVRTKERTPGSSRWNVTGRYYDKLVRHPREGWLFAERLWVPDALVEGLPDW
jgi:uncharacterized protein (TIGR02246 family)